MSTPHEASLTEKERAILAGLAAQAEAEDPSLAATLRGRARRAGGIPRFTPRLRVPAVLRHWGWGAVLALVGLVLMLASLSISILAGIVGALLAAAGVYRAVSAHPGRAKKDDKHDASSGTSSP